MKKTLISAACIASIAACAQTNVNAVAIVDAPKIYGFTGDGGLAVNAHITMPALGAYNSNGTLFFSDINNFRIRSVNSASIINTICGNGTSSFNGDGGLASLAELKTPYAIGVGQNNHVYVSDASKIRRINSTTGIITTIAGTAVQGFSGDGALAINAQLTSASDIEVDNQNNIFFIDQNAARVRKINTTTGIITTVAGNGTAGFAGDGGQATLAQISATDIEISNNGTIYIASWGRVRRVAPNGIITTIAGTGANTNTGDGGPANAATINGDKITLDGNGNLLVSSLNSNNMACVRKIDNAGIINTLYNVVTGNNSGVFPGFAITKLEINPSSGNVVALFGAICMIDAAIYELMPCDATPPPPPANTLIASNSGAACLGSIVQLNALGNNGTYSWTGPNGFTSNLQNPLLTNISSNMAGIYTVVLTNAQGSLTQTTQVTIKGANVAMNPTSSGNVCEGGLVQLNSNSNSQFNCYWTGPNGFESNLPIVSLQEINLSQVGTYTLNTIDLSGCVSKSTVNVMVYPKLNTTINVSKVKTGCAPLLANEFSATTNKQINNYSWNFSNGTTSLKANPTNIDFKNGGDYKVTLKTTDINGCENETEVTVTAFANPKADFNFSNNASFSNPKVDFNDASSNTKIATWNWKFSNDVNATSTQQHPSYTYQDSGVYNVTLKVVSDKGCENTIQKNVIIKDDISVLLPNAFTPNGDGQNDVFMAISNSTTKFEMQIYNRAGSLVFQSGDIKKGWDGNVKGQMAQNGVYVYKISYTTSDGKNHATTGSVILVK